MSAETTVNQLIVGQNDRASELTQEVISAAQEAQLAAITSTNIPAVPPIPLPGVTVPGANPFAVDQTGEFKVAFDSKAPFGSFLPQFTAGFNDFVNTYFPDIAGCIKENSDNWICDMIVNGGNGIPPAIDQQIWDRARSRENELFLQNVDTATAEWAARGYALPGGALTARVQQAQQDAIDKAATISRDRAIKNIEIQIENIRFAIEQAVKLRLGALQLAVDYVKAYLRPVELSIEYAKSLTDAHYRYFGAMSDYYRAVIGAAALTIEVQKANQGAAVASNESFAKLVASITASRAGAAASAAAALGRAAAAALGALNSVADIGHLTTKQE